MVADPKHHRLEVVECSAIAAGRAPHELANELAALFKGKGSTKSKVDKLVARTEWVRQNLTDVLDEVGIFNTALEEEEILSIKEKGLKELLAAPVDAKEKLATVWGQMKRSP